MARLLSAYRSGLLKTIEENERLLADLPVSRQTTIGPDGVMRVKETPADPSLHGSVREVLDGGEVELGEYGVTHNISISIAITGSREKRIGSSETPS